MKINLLLKKIKSIPLAYQKYGLDGVIYATLRNLGIKTKYNSIIDKKKDHTQKKIIHLTKKKIISGYYKSTYLNCNTSWSGFHYSSKLLGLYEHQVQEKIIQLQKKYQLENIVNFGAADGFHIIGLIKNKYFKKGIAFEIDKQGQKYLQDNINMNNLREKIVVSGKADFEKVIDYLNEDELKKNLFLVDVEGDEFSIFNENNLRFFRKSFLIIENHSFLVNDEESKKKFFQLMKNNFSLEILQNSGRNPYAIDEIQDLDDDERWLIMSEGRPKKMDWIVCVPL